MITGARLTMSYLTLAVLSHFILVGTAFLLPDWRASAARNPEWRASAARHSDWRASAAREPPTEWTKAKKTQLFSSPQTPEVRPEGGMERNVEQNSLFIASLMDNLGALCDKYIMSGSPKSRERVFNVLDRIAADALDEDLVKQSIRLAKRAGVPMEKTFLEKYANELGKTDSERRRQEALERKQWESKRTSEVGANVAQDVDGRSALSRRGADGKKPDLFMASVLSPDIIATIAKDKKDLQREMNHQPDSEEKGETEQSSAAASRVSELIAKAGSGVSFEGETLGIGGLDDVLAQVKRRVWTPLAAPPQLLEELGIHPVRGLLLYGKPGCGKTLMARTLGKVLSPMRPLTVVSGPEIMDKFVGSSEKNLREIFDNPPDIYDRYRIGEADGGDAVANAALHVVVMDEFDAVARTRGGRGGKGEQGDAGVARDSVVNQLLAKMDGVQPLPVPTLVIGLTNKRSLIEPALLRPGRFEVQVEVPPPRTTEQRVSILKVHTMSMNAAGRLLVRDPPPGTAAERYLERFQPSDIMSYESLLEELAKDCVGYSGAALAGVARAAASHALERAVNEFSQQVNGGDPTTASSTGLSIMDCLVTREDFNEAVADVLSSMGNSDHSDEDSEDDTSKEGMPAETDNAKAPFNESPDDSISP